MTRKGLLLAPRREWDKILVGVTGVYVIPSRRKHDSGWACMDFVASTPEGLVRFGGGCDVVRFDGDGFAMDCDYDTKLLHIWNRNNSFSVSHDLSSIDFMENK